MKGRRHGWFVLPGVQTGDRTLEEQAHGVWPAIHAAAGKHVLDLGCAEGLISHEFAKAGAARVLAVDSVADHLAVARQLFAHEAITYRQADLNVAMVGPMLDYFDVVVALAVLQKLFDPAQALRWSASMVRPGGQLLLRNGKREKNGHLSSKINARRAPVADTLQQCGLVWDRTEPGHPRRPEDVVQYWGRPL